MRPAVTSHLLVNNDGDGHGVKGLVSSLPHLHTQGVTKLAQTLTASGEREGERGERKGGRERRGNQLPHQRLRTPAHTS